MDELISNHHRPLHHLHERYQRARLRYLGCLVNNSNIEVQLSQCPQTRSYVAKSSSLSSTKFHWQTPTDSKGKNQNPLAHAVNAKADLSTLSCACFTYLLCWFISPPILASTVNCCGSCLVCLWLVRCNANVIDGYGLHIKQKGRQIFKKSWECFTVMHRRSSRFWVFEDNMSWLTVYLTKPASANRHSSL